MLTPALLSTGSESLPDFGRLQGGQQIPRRVIILNRGGPLKLAAILAERDRRRDPADAEIVPRGVESEKDDGASELLVPGPPPVSVPGASDARGITLLGNIP